MSTNNYCVNCDHYKKDYLLEYCTRTVAINRVSGQEYHHLCSSERSPLGGCGTDGLHFTQIGTQLELDFAGDANEECPF